MGLAPLRRGHRRVLVTARLPAGRTVTVSRRFQDYTLIESLPFEAWAPAGALPGRGTKPAAHRPP